MRRSFGFAALAAGMLLSIDAKDARAHDLGDHRPANIVPTLAAIPASQRESGPNCRWRVIPRLGGGYFVRVAWSCL